MFGKTTLLPAQANTAQDKAQTFKNQQKDTAYGFKEFAGGEEFLGFLLVKYIHFGGTALGL